MAPTRKISALLFLFTLSSSWGYCQKTQIQYLSGTDKDNTVKWDFYCTSGMNSGKWSRIEVPSNWELQGFGTYSYGADDLVSDEKGLYRYEFNVPEEWKKKTVKIVFEGSMTDTEVKINGIHAGPVYQGGFSGFSYNISGLLNYKGTNLLEVTVSKVSSNQDIRMPDSWIFGGIYRPVYLESLPKQYIGNIAIDARADGSFHMDVSIKGDGKAQIVNAVIYNASGYQVGTISAPVTNVSPGKVEFNCFFQDILPWNPESPNMYRVDVMIVSGRKTLHQVSEKFGFRTVEVREGDGIYVNGSRIILKGVCHSTFWPSSGRTSSRQLAVEDVSMMKDMNMNAVRLIDIPSDEFFLDVCDSLGLFVLNDENVLRDVNHPSVIAWSTNGGYEDIVDESSEYDPQKRPVIEPSTILNGINAIHYPGYSQTEKIVNNNKEIFLPTEILHGLYDGGLGSGLKDYWDLLTSKPSCSGAFLYSFADEGIERRDKSDSIDTNGNRAANGILGPYHEKEGSFYTIKDVWSPVKFTGSILSDIFDGQLEVSNNYIYSNLNSCSFSHRLVRFIFPEGISGEVGGDIVSPDIAPGQKGFLSIKLPSDWHDYDALYLTAYDQYHRVINTWSWRITEANEFAGRSVLPTTEKVSLTEKGNSLVFKSGKTEIVFNRKTGILTGVGNYNRMISLKCEELFAGAKKDFTAMSYYRSEEGYVVDTRYKNDAFATWTIMGGGWLKLSYGFRLKNPSDPAGISFSYPEKMVTGAILLADGPYRVWKNRMEGTQFGLHEKKYNNTVTGQSWEYPEFKGYYSNFYAVEIETLEAPFTIISSTANQFLHLFTPEKPSNTEIIKGNLTPSFPKGDISILQSIPAMGTKFSSPEQEGPQGITLENKGVIRGTVYFRFGE